MTFDEADVVDSDQPKLFELSSIATPQKPKLIQKVPTLLQPFEGKKVHIYRQNVKTFILILFVLDQFIVSYVYTPQPVKVKSLVAE